MFLHLVVLCLSPLGGPGREGGREGRKGGREGGKRGGEGCHTIVYLLLQLNKKGGGGNSV